MLPVPQADVEQEAAEEFELAVVDNPNSGRDRDELMFLNTELVDQVHAPDQHRGSRVGDGLDVGGLVLGRLRDLQLFVAVTRDGDSNNDHRMGVWLGPHPPSELVLGNVRQSFHLPPLVFPLRGIREQGEDSATFIVTFLVVSFLPRHFLGGGFLLTD